MKKAEYDAIIKKLSNPDLLSEGLVELSNKLDEDEKDFDRINESINSLRDVNSRLALSITNKVDNTPTEEDIEAKENEALEAEFLNMFKKEG